MKREPCATCGKVIKDIDQDCWGNDIWNCGCSDYLYTLGYRRRVNRFGLQVDWEAILTGALVIGAILYVWMRT